MTPSQAQRLLSRHRTPAQFFFWECCLWQNIVCENGASTSKKRWSRQSECPFVMQLCNYCRSYSPWPGTSEEPFAASGAVGNLDGPCERWAKAKGLMKNSSCQRSFVLKVASNHGKRYANFQKGYLATAGNTIIYIVHLFLRAKLGMKSDISLSWQPFRL